MIEFSVNLLSFQIIATFKRRRPAPRPNFFYINRNDYIRANELFVVDDEGEALGVMSKFDALRLARERGLDLIEISPKANPPVAKIMEWSKYKYELTKKKKESKSKSIEQKEMWFKAFIDDGDLNHKLKKVQQFLKKKHPVKIQIRSVKRANRTHLSDLMTKILTILGEEVVSDPPKFEGRNLSVIVRPGKITQNT